MHTEQLHWGKSTENLYALIETVLFRDSTAPSRRGAGAKRTDRVVGRSPASAPTVPPGLLDRLEDWLARGRQRQLDRYLAQSSDVFDLERRLQALAREPQSQWF